MKIKTGSLAKKIKVFILLTALFWSCMPIGNAPHVSAQNADKIVSLAKLSKQEVVSSTFLSAMKNAEKQDENRVSRVAPSTFYWILNVEFTTPAARRQQFTDVKKSNIDGMTVLTVIDRFADVFLTSVDAEEILQKLAGNPAVLRIEGFERVSAPPPPPVESSPIPSRAVPDEIVRDGVGALKGKNVIIAVLDTGIDFRHPDFINYDASGRKNSRLLYLWDTSLEYKKGRGSVAPFSFPNTTSIGTLFSKQQLTNELNAATQTIPPTDLDGHGTACAGIAAGNGNADFRETNGLKRKEVIGVAPVADIIGVRLGKKDLENGYLLNAICEWLDKVAGVKPLVVSGSFGGHWKGHDGESVEERQLDARFPLGKQSRAIVFAAGNEGSDAIHATVNVSRRENAQWIKWKAFTKTYLNIFFDTGAGEDIVLEFPDGSTLQANSNWDYNKITRQSSIELNSPFGDNSIKIYTLSGKTVKADLYLPAEAEFDSSQANYEGLVGSPGTMRNAITVGSYDWNDGFHEGGAPTFLKSVCRNTDGILLSIEVKKISCYSSPGPTRDARRKPEVASPGQWFTASRAKGLGTSERGVDTTKNYRRMNGTSAATPYTAGIIALMFEKKPLLKLGEIRTLLETKSTKDSFTSVPPTSYWGNGKLDVTAVRQILDAIK